MRHFLFSFLLITSLPAVGQWQRVNNPIAARTSNFDGSIEAVDGQTAWFNDATAPSSPRPAKIYRSSNGGLTWQDVTPPSPAGFRLISCQLEALGVLNAWACVEIQDINGGSVTNQLLATMDGGATWAPRSLPAATLPRSIDIHFFNSTEGLLFNGRTKLMHRSSDGGQTWQQLTSFPALPSGSTANGFDQMGQVFGLYVNLAPNTHELWLTSDRGLTWRTMPLPTFPWGGIKFRDAQHGLMFGGGVMKTDDGGATWTSLAAPPFSIGTLSPVPGTQAYVAGAFKFEGVTRVQPTGSAVTYDDGVTWRLLENSNAYLQIQFIAPTAGWAIEGVVDPGTTHGEYRGMSRYTGAALITSSGRPRKLAVEVYPNPSASGEFSVRLPQDTKAIGVRVTDALGRGVYEAATLPASQRLDLGRQAKGLYTLEIQTSQGLLRQKLLVQ